MDGPSVPYRIRIDDEDSWGSYGGLICTSSDQKSAAFNVFRDDGAAPCVG